MDWVAVNAVSSAIIAFVLVIVGAWCLVLGMRIMKLIGAVEGFVQTIDRETRPVVDSAKSLVADTVKTVARLRNEVEAMTDTTHDVHGRVVAAVDNMDERLRDLGALMDVIQEELEDTVLDVGAALRTTRRGATLFRTVRRALTGKKKKRRRR